jgi:hypothetical protein
MKRFKLIEDHRLHGWEAQSTFLKIEVVRAYAGEWHVFCHLAGKPCRPLSGYEDRSLPYQEAMGLAHRILRNWEAPPDRRNPHLEPQPHA